MIEPTTGEPVELQLRRAMTKTEKRRRWYEVGGRCAVCGEPCGFLTEVIWDHRVPLAMGGTNDLSNMEPNHVGECAAKKTARDQRNIAKAKRLERDANPETRRQSPFKLRGRGFGGRDPLK